MSICFRAKHLDDTTLVECGYAAFGGYRIRLAQEMNPLFGLMYKAHYGANWVRDDNDELYADVDVPLEAWIADNIELAHPEVYQRHPGAIPPEISELEQKIIAWTAQCDAIENVRVARHWFDNKWCVTFRLLWSKMCDWCDDHLDEICDSLFFAPDVGGKWGWQECRELYRFFSQYNISFNYNHAYHHIEDMHSRMLQSWYACWKNRVRLTWS